MQPACNMHMRVDAGLSRVVDAGQSVVWQTARRWHAPSCNHKNPLKATTAVK